MGISQIAVSNPGDFFLACCITDLVNQNLEEVLTSSGHSGQTQLVTCHAEGSQNSKSSASLQLTGAQGEWGSESI